MSNQYESTPEAVRLNKRCSQLEQSAQEALKWLGDNRERVGAEEESLRRSMRRHIREARKLARASVRKVSVGVFGPSQSGKSYLMTTLANTQAKLAVQLGEQRFDFLADINPAGDQESTGVVTRFGTSTLEGRPEAPVVLRMLSRNDLLKIFSTAYILNTRLDENSVLSVDAVSTHLQSFSEKRESSGDHSDFELDIAELRDYIADRCSDKAIVSALNAARFWERAAEIGASLDQAGRARLFSILWGEHELMTEVFSELDGILEKLNNSEIVYAQIDALIPRESGIQDVETLKKLGSPDEPHLPIRTDTGISINIPRASLAALTAELQVRLQGESRPFLKHTDLLDFPGLRPPVEIENPAQAILRGGSDEDDEEGMLGDSDTRMAIGNVILRGKVDYLFRRFSEDYEINALLLLLKPGNQDVQSLPKIIRHWVDITQGDTPKRRESRTTSLFVVLSWFDTMFGQKAGDTDPGRRFEVRIDTVMKFFKQAGEWPQTWTTGKPFQNLYWLRNPKIEQPGLMDYEGSWGSGSVPKETGIDPDAIEKRDLLLQAHGSNAVVRRHFPEPDIAFEAALEINDGGAKYIADKLEPVCTPHQKLDQIGQQTLRYEKELSDILDRFYVSDNRVEQIQLRMEAASVLRLELEACQKRDRFASLQRLMQVTPDALLGLYQHILTRREPEDESLPTAESRQREADIGPSTLEQRFARAAISFWLATSRENLMTIGARKQFRLTEEGVATMVDELAAAARREEVEQSLTTSLSTIMGFRDVSADRISLAAAESINRFVENLSLDKSRLMREIGYVELDGIGELGLPDSPTRYWSEVDEAWIESFVEVIRKNAEAQIGGESVDPEQNARLGKLLELLGRKGPSEPMENTE